MPLSYGGVGLIPPDVNDPGVRWWHGHRIEEFDYQGYLTAGISHLPVPYAPNRESPRLGALNWPTSASRWATCYLVASGEQLAAIRTAIGSTPRTRPLVMLDGNNTITTEMWLLPPRPILQKGQGEFYLLTLVDDRWWWWQAGNKQVLSDPVSWTHLLTDLFSSVGVTPSLESVPSAYSTPSGRWAVGYKPLPPIIDAVCQTVGMRVVRQLDGSVSCQRYATAAAQDAANWTSYRYEVLAGGQLAISDIALSVPSSASVVFLGDSPTVITITLSSLAIAAYGTALGASGKSAMIVADMPATASSAARTSYATQSTTDYYSWALARTDATLRGFHNRLLTGLDEFQEWIHAPDQLVTRIVRNVYSDRNIYGDVNSPLSGWVPGAGSGSGVDCTNALDPVTFNCDNGKRIATVKSLQVGIENGQLVVKECDETEFDLGPCSPSNPDGTPVPVAVKVCPVFTTLNYLDHSSTPQTIQVITSLVVERKLVVVAIADAEGCVEYQPEDCCGVGSGSGSIAEPQCTTACGQCATGMSAIWELTVEGLDPIALTHVEFPDDGNYCRFISDDLVWDFRYENDLDLWVLTNLDDGRVWYVDGALFNCFGDTNLIPVDDGEAAATVSPVYLCTTITYDCTTGGCVAVAGSGGQYATLAECQANCSVDRECIGHTFTNATATISNQTGNCVCLPTNLTRADQGVDYALFGISAPCTTGSLTLECFGGLYTIIVSGVQESITYVSFVANPFTLVVDVVMTASPTNPCTGSFRVTITDPP